MTITKGVPVINGFVPVLPAGPTITSAEGKTTITIDPTELAAIWAAIEPQLAKFCWQEFDSHKPGGIWGDIVDPVLSGFLNTLFGADPNAPATK